VSGFYEEHQGLIDALPPALFRTQLRNRFPEGGTPEEAWRAAQEMIAGMLPLIAQGRERQRAEREEQKQRDERARRLRREIGQLEQQAGQLNRSSVSDPEVVADEVKALQEQIRSFQEEIRSLEAEEGGTP